MVLEGEVESIAGIRNNTTTIDFPVTSTQDGTMDFYVCLYYYQTMVSDGEEIPLTLKVEYVEFAEEESPLLFELNTDSNLNLYWIITGVKDLSATDISIPAYYKNLPIKEMYSDTFRNNAVVENITFEEGCGFNSIYGYQFSGCTNLQSITFGPNVQISSIGSYAFQNCTRLKSFQIPASITTVESNAFAGTNISSAYFNVLNILHANAFNGCSNLSTINIPNCSIIGEGAFKDCINLDSVKYGTIGTAVSSFAFNGCSKLKDISFENFTSIGNNSFENCVSLEKANFNQCSSIGSSAFYGCSNINQITISKCSRIGLYAFANCPNLEKVYINNSSIFCSLDGSYVFCTHNDSSFSINSNIIFYFDADVYGNYLDDKYWKHYSAYMANIVKNNQLIYKSNNNEIIKTIETISCTNDYVNGVYGLITFNTDNVEELGPIFEYPERLISIDIPSKCKKICEKAFSDCANLKSITLSNTLSEIGDYAFNHCESLTSFTIPDTIINLGEGIFAGCKSIKRFEGNQKYIRNNKKILVDSNKLLCVLPTDDSETEGRYYKISEIDENTVTSVALDGFRLAKATYPIIEQTARVSVIVPGRSLNEINKTRKNSEL